MKTALAIVCILAFAWTRMVLAQAPGAGAELAVTEPCPCSCGTEACCSAQPVSEPQPVSAAPLIFSQTLAPASAVFTLLPFIELPAPDGSFPEVSPVFSGPLYERNCVLLI